MTAETRVFETMKQLLLLLSIYVVVVLIINGVAGTGSNHDPVG